MLALPTSHHMCVRTRPACVPHCMLRSPCRPVAAAKRFVAVAARHGLQPRITRKRCKVVATNPQPETEEAPAAAPQEWETPMPSKRPDIFPEFEKLQTVLPKPLPGDPEMPDEELEEEKVRGPPPGDPEPADEDEEGEETEEPEEVPGKPPNVPERPRPDLPKIPE